MNNLMLDKQTVNKILYLDENHIIKRCRCIRITKIK